VIDLHAHPLPGLDDGPASLAEALSLARAAVAAGTTTMTATPHIDHRWGVDPGAVHEAVAAFNAELRSEGIDLEVLPGGEIALPRLIDLTSDEVTSLGLGGGPFILVECPLGRSLANFDGLIFDRLVAGQRILLAHPERCPPFQREPEKLARLVEAGALTSVTSNALSGRFGETPRRFGIDLLAGGLAHSVASDAHDARRRPPGLVEGLHAAERDIPGVGELAGWLTVEVPQAILAGERPPPPPPTPTRRQHPARAILSRLRRTSPRPAHGRYHA
jgi:protein-tyrosine phosphatase